MDLNNLSKTSKKARRRVGRGNGSGSGKTCGKGHKGQRARAGGKVAPYFEGGQMPLYRRLPIRGFNNKDFKKEYQIVNCGQLSFFAENTEVTPLKMFEEGIINSLITPIKILGEGEVKTLLKVSAHKFSKTAVEKITSKGGEIIIL